MKFIVAVKRFPQTSKTIL